MPASAVRRGMPAGRRAINDEEEEEEEEEEDKTALVLAEKSAAEAGDGEAMSEAALARLVATAKGSAAAAGTPLPPRE